MHKAYGKEVSGINRGEKVDTSKLIAGKIVWKRQLTQPFIGGVELRNLRSLKCFPEWYIWHKNTYLPKV